MLKLMQAARAGVRRVGDQRMGCEMCSRCQNLFKMPESVALMRRAPNVTVGRSFSPHYCILYYSILYVVLRYIAVLLYKLTCY